MSRRRPLRWLRRCGTDGRPLRTVIYAAGIGSTKRSVVDTPLDEFQQLWQANALGFVAVWQAVADLARADARQRGGHQLGGGADARAAATVRTARPRPRWRRSR